MATACCEWLYLRWIGRPRPLSRVEDLPTLTAAPQSVDGMASIEEADEEDEEYERRVEELGRIAIAIADRAGVNMDALLARLDAEDAAERESSSAAEAGPSGR